MIRATVGPTVGFDWAKYPPPPPPSLSVSVCPPWPEALRRVGRLSSSPSLGACLVVRRELWSERAGSFGFGWGIDIYCPVWAVPGFTGGSVPLTALAAHVSDCAMLLSCITVVLYEFRVMSESSNAGLLAFMSPLLLRTLSTVTHLHCESFTLPVAGFGCFP